MRGRSVGRQAQMMALEQWLATYGSTNLRENNILPEQLQSGPNDLVHRIPSEVRQIQRDHNGKTKNCDETRAMDNRVSMLMFCKQLAKQYSQPSKDHGQC